MADLTAEPMAFHGPGWTIAADDRSYMLWAPNDKRDFWSASWDRDGGMRGDHRRGDSPAAALDCFPRDAEAQQARTALLASAAAF